MIPFDLDIRTPLGRVAGRIQLPERMRLAELSWSALGLDEQLIAQAVRYDLRNGDRKISCAKGCGACCRQVVPVSVPEAFMIAGIVQEMPKEERTAVLRRMTEVQQAVRGAGLTGHFENERFVGLGLAYFSLGHACPFLVDEACSIHQNRPFICREFLVTSPASFCADANRFTEVRAIRLGARMTNVMGKVAAQLLGEPVPTMPLIDAVDWAIEHHELGARSWESTAMMNLFVETLHAELAPNDA